MYRVTESLGSRARVDVHPIMDGAGGTFATRRGTDGREYAQYGIGNSMLAVPLYWIGAAACRVIGNRTAEEWLSFRTVDYLPENEPSGHARLKRFAVSFFGSFVAAATASLLWFFGRNVYNRAARAHSLDPSATDFQARRAAGMVALSYAIGTMAWPHARTFFSEPLATFFSLLAFYYVAKRESLAVWNALGAGLAFALALLTRLDSLVLLPALGVLLLVQLPSVPAQGELSNISSVDQVPDPHTSVKGRTSLQQIAAFLARRVSWSNLLLIKVFGLPIAVFALLHFGLNHLHFGSAFTTAYADQREGVNFSTPLLAGLYGFFMSIGKSAVLFSPALLLGLAGWRRFAGMDRALAWCLGMAVVLKVLVHATWQNWPGGWCWGPRHIFLAHAFAMLPALGFFATRTPIRGMAARLLIFAAALVQLYGTSQSFIDYYILYYRTPFSPPQARVMFAPDDTAPGIFRVEMAHPERGWQPVPVAALIAPINDSIYVPQNSQWYRYAEMWNMGYTDNLWLRLVQRARGREPDMD